MAGFNGKQVMLVGLKGDSVFIRYSASADGTNFTETRSAGQNYIGIAVGQIAPTDKSAYEWIGFAGGSTSDLEDRVSAIETELLLIEQELEDL